MIRRLAIAALFIGLPMGMLYPLWSCPVSAGEDDLIFYWPVRKIAADMVRRGELPLWNPYEAMGVPLAADPQTAVGFPANWLFVALSTDLAYSLCIFGAFAAAGGGAYLYLRGIGLSTPAAIFGGIAFQFCGFMVGHRVHLAMIQAAAFLPWGLWAIEKLRAGRARSAFLWLAAIFTLTLAAGHWPVAIQMSVVWLAYLLLRGRPLLKAAGVVAAAAGVALLVMSPQIIATYSYVRTSIRADVPYSVATENSFFPLCAVLAFFPFIMGCRTPNFFGHDWWGPWHLCEMLGYVGLITLVLAAGAMWCFYRKPRDPNPWASGASSASVGADVNDLSPTPIVRAWTWILIGAGIWALGQYTPVYRLIHMIPVIGMVRCPARMLLAIDLGLITLAAVAVHALTTGGAPRLARPLRWIATLALPSAMAFFFGALWVLLLIEGRWWSLAELLSGDKWYGMSDAISTPSPATHVPLALLALTIAAIWWAAHRPRRAACLLTVLLLVDVFFIARFVDVPAADAPKPDPLASPAAEWLRKSVPDDKPFRVLGLTESHHERATVALLPMSCGGLGYETLSYYGPLQPAEHALLFGFRPWGRNEHADWLVRRNHLLALYNVRYVVTDDPWLISWLEEANTTLAKGDGHVRRVGTNGWDLTRAQWRTEVLCLQAGVGAEASAKIRMKELEERFSGFYRVSFEARAPDGAGRPLAVSRHWPGMTSGPWAFPESLRVDIEQLTDQWRRFETFLVKTGEYVLAFKTWSRQPIEVRHIQVIEGGPLLAKAFSGGLKPREAVYVDGTPDGLPPWGKETQRKMRVHTRFMPQLPTPVHIFENKLCLPRRWPVRREDIVILPDRHEVIEALRWKAHEYDFSKQVLVARTDLPGGLLPAGEYEWIAERRDVRGDAGCYSANGMGCIRRLDAPEGPPPPRWWPFWLTTAGLMTWGGVGVFRRRRADPTA